MPGRSHAKPVCVRPLLAVGADTGQVTRDALVEADNPLRKLVHGGDQSQSYGRHNQRVLHQVLSLLVAYESNYECFHRTSRIFAFYSWPAAVLAPSGFASSSGP